MYFTCSNYKFKKDVTTQAIIHVKVTRIHEMFVEPARATGPFISNVKVTGRLTRSNTGDLKHAM